MPDRLDSARGLADDRRILATAIESTLHTRFTYDTLRALRRRFPRIRFVWLMGADNLVQLPRWQHWTGIARTMPFAVMPRPTYNQRALSGQAAQRLRPALLPAPGRRRARRPAPSRPGHSCPPSRTPHRPPRSANGVRPRPTSPGPARRSCSACRSLPQPAIRRRAGHRPQARVRPHREAPRQATPAEAGAGAGPGRQIPRHAPQKGRSRRPPPEETGRRLAQGRPAGTARPHAGRDRREPRGRQGRGGSRPSTSPAAPPSPTAW